MIDYTPIFRRYERRRMHWRQWVKRNYIDAFGLLPGTMLDAACGNGFWGSLFAEWGYTVRGFDRNPIHVEDGAQRHPSAHVELADIRDPLPFGTFDLVFCRALPEFYAADSLAAVTAAANLLGHVGPGGLLMLAMVSNQSGVAIEGLAGEQIHNHPHAALLGIVGDRLLDHRSHGNSLTIVAR